jgi:predicted lipoprotein with Yx(FWY)xxD motif
MATRRTSLRIGGIAVLAAVIAVVASSSAFASKSGAQHVAKAATVQTRNIKKLGTVLVNSKGLTLYMFVPDKQKKVTCKGSCAAIWPPLKLKAGQKATAGGAAKKGLLGKDKNPSGGFVVTYNRWPLYTYVADSKPGQASGQALDLNGGLWYVLSPSGKIIKKK